MIIHFEVRTPMNIRCDEQIKIMERIRLVFGSEFKEEPLLSNLPVRAQLVTSLKINNTLNHPTKFICRGIKYKIVLSGLTWMIFGFLVPVLPFSLLPSHVFTSML